MLKLFPEIGGRFSVFCVNLGSFCCILRHPAPPAVRSRSISPVRGPSIAAPSFCIILGSFCAGLQRFGGCRTPQKRPQIVEVRLRRLSFQPSGVLRSFCNALAPFCAVVTWHSGFHPHPPAACAKAAFCSKTAKEKKQHPPGGSDVLRTAF